MKYLLILLLSITTTVGHALVVHDTYNVKANTYSEVDLSDIDSDSQWIRLKVVFHETKESLNEGLAGQARAWSKDKKIDGTRWCIMNILRPSSWNDKQVMVDAGHEILHCLGGEH